MKLGQVRTVYVRIRQVGSGCYILFHARSVSFRIGQDRSGYIRSDKVTLCYVMLVNVTPGEFR